MRKLKIRTPDGVVEIEGEISTGLYDRHKKEIFEGDLVVGGCGRKEVVEFKNNNGEAFFYPFGIAMSCGHCSDAIEEIYDTSTLMNCEILKK